MGVPHFCSTFLACLYQRYLSSNIEQLLAVLEGIEVHPVNKNKNKIINLFGVSLTQTAAYMKKSKLFIGNDSGLSHMASATKLKSIVLFGPTNDLIYGPFMQDSQVIRTNESYDYFKSINIDKTKSYMDSISVEKIYSTLQKNNYCE